MQEIPNTLSALESEFPELVMSLENIKKDNTIKETKRYVIYHGIDSKSNQEVSIKEFTADTLTKEDELRYVTEIYLQRKCNHRFISQILGFTTKKPFAIITEFFKNGVMAEKLYRNNNKIAFSGTHLSTIALALTHSLSYMHNIGISHANISANTISLDDKNISRLNFFDFAKTGKMQLNSEQPIISNAPETLKDNTYTSKSDIFSLAFIFYEFSEGINPFANKNDKEIAELINNPSKFLQFSSSPAELQKLILDCWDQNPKKRPEAIKIFEMFSNGQVFFNKTETKRINNISQKILENFKAREESDEIISKEIKLPDPPQRYFDFYNFDQSPEFQIDESLISNPSQPKFIENLRLIASNLNDNTAKKFYDLTAQFTTPKYASHIRQYVLDTYFQTMSSTKKLIDVCYENQFYFHLPLTDDLINSSIDVITALFIYRPVLMTSDLFEIIKFIIEKKPKDAITLYSLYIRSLPPIHVSYHPLMVLLDNYQKLLSQSASSIQFVRFLNQLIKSNHIMKSILQPRLSKIIENLFNTQDLEVIKETYSFLLCNNITYNDYNVINKHLSRAEPIQSLFQYLLSQKGNFPPDVTFLSLLVNWSQVSTTAQYCLYHFAHQCEANSLLISKTNIWLDKNFVNPYGCFILLLIIMKYKSVVPNLVKHTQLPLMLMKYVMSKDPFILISISQITQIFVKNLQTFNVFDECGFFSSFFSVSCEISEKIVGEQTMAMLRYLSQFRHSTGFVHYYTALCRFLAMQNELSAQAITTILCISKQPLGAQSLVQLKLESYFHSLLNIPEYRQIATEFFRNIGVAV